MLEHTINKIEERLRKTESLNEGNKSELLYLLSTLKVEIADLSKTHNEQAESITGFAELSTHEATRRKRTWNYSNCLLKVWAHLFEASNHLIQNWLTSLMPYVLCSLI